MDSILDSIKKLLGIAPEYTAFDSDIIMHINSVFFILSQLGIGPADGFSIADKTAVWTDFVPNIANLEALKTYVYLKVKLLFDPPSSSAVADATNRQISELEWRLNVAAESMKAQSQEGT